MKNCAYIFIALMLTSILVLGCSPIISTPNTSSTSGLLPSESDLPDGMGRLVINITDPPPPLESVEVNFFPELWLHKAGGSWDYIELEKNSFDLLDLDGVSELLANHITEAGIYTQIRIYLDTVWVTVAGETHEARVPSGTIKLVGSFEVVDGGLTTVTVDINGAKSVETGNGEYIFRPVVKLLIESDKPSEEENGQTTETPTVELTESVTTTL